ncbi:MAG: hypothetical protein KGL19_07955 [Bacteroidota bacterium]|nr:hypothetical protein [Bacteroidota bacterium]
MSARIIIDKTSGIFFRASVFTVYFDGKEVAKMHDKKTFVLEDAGVYAIQLKTNWLKTQILIVKVNNGETIDLSIRNGMKYYTGLYLTFIGSLLLNGIFLSGKIQRPHWFVSVQVFLMLGFVAYTVFYLIFKKGEVWILEDANKEHF